MSQTAYRLAADVVLAVHTGFVLFMILGLALTLIGGWRGWRWVRNPWFRIAHLVGIGVVAAQAWLGRICPLTTWEVALRHRAGDPSYDGSFIGHWLGRLLYIDAPMWAFAVAYSLFGLLIVGSWWWVRPRPFR